MATFVTLADELEGLATALREVDNGLEAIRQLQERIQVVSLRLESTRERVANILARFEGEG